MKKLGVLVVAGAMMMSLASGLHALTFTFEQSELLQFWGVAENPEDTYTSFGYANAVGDKSVEYMATISSIGEVANNTLSTFSQILLGANFWGTSDTGSGATVADLGASDLSGYSRYGMGLENTNEDIWAVNLFLNTGYTDLGEENRYYEAGWNWLNPGDSTSLFLDLTGVQNLHHVTAIGLNIGSNMGAGGGYPSTTDTAHIAATPIPEPGSMLLLVSGLLGLVGFAGKKRGFFKV